MADLGNLLFVSASTVYADGAIVGRRRRAVLRVWPSGATLTFQRPLIIGTPDHLSELVVEVLERDPEKRDITIRLNAPRMVPDAPPRTQYRSLFRKGGGDLTITLSAPFAP